jgi:hypothetical protein
MFCIRVFFRMCWVVRRCIRCIRRIGRIGTTLLLLHLHIVGFEFNVLGSVEYTIEFVAGRYGSRAFTPDCGGEVCFAWGVGFVV